MANKKHRSTKEELSAQKRRTYRNLADKYLKLLDKFPNNPHARKWHDLLEFYSKN